MTPARRFSRATRRRPLAKRSWIVPRTLPGALLALTSQGAVAAAQTRGEAPMAPAATIGAVTDAPTFSLLGVAALPDGSGNALANRNEVWMGATQPVGQLGRVRLAALASGNMRFRDGMGSTVQADGLLSLRARARFGDQRVWSAVSYGRSSADGSPTLQLIGGPTVVPMSAPGSASALVSDTTVARRVDVGQIGRAEAGMITRYAGVEFAFGLSLERATRVTTQTVTVDGSAPASVRLGSDGTSMSSTLRTVQRRDLATGLASMGFNTGSTEWLLSVTAPVASWVSSDELAPRPQTIPTVASLAIVQPVNGWLSLVGAAATNAATMSATVLRDELRARDRRAFSPVVALGLRISRAPWRRSDDDGTPGGILAFETRTLGTVDSASVEPGTTAADSRADTLRVVLLIDAPRAESVELMGDATQWSVTQMRRLQSGRWRAELKLAPGMHRLIVRADGGQWVAPPGLPVGTDEYGTPVGMVLVRPPR